MAQQLSVLRTCQPHTRCSSTDGNTRRPQLIQRDTRLMAWHASSCNTSRVCAICSVRRESQGVKRWICCTEEILSAPWVPLASWLSWMTWRGKHSVCTSCAVGLYVWEGLLISIIKVIPSLIFKVNVLQCVGTAITAKCRFFLLWTSVVKSTHNSYVAFKNITQAKVKFTPKNFSESLTINVKHMYIYLCMYCMPFISPANCDSDAAK